MHAQQFHKNAICNKHHTTFVSEYRFMTLPLPPPNIFSLQWDYFKWIRAQCHCICASNTHYFGETTVEGTALRESSVKLKLCLLTTEDDITFYYPNRLREFNSFPLLTISNEIRSRRSKNPFRYAIFENVFNQIVANLPFAGKLFE